jgi:hypothetical protein
MKKFFKHLVSGVDDVSSKRVASLFLLVNVVVLSYISAIKNGGQLPQYMFDALCLLTGSGLGLTSLEKIFSKKEEVKVESVKEYPKDEEPI